eukprot:comp21025_c0_seq1/m.28235 comp21025_c0_seq1/g.28235  ORF comp21025_c0_seq1/g.28235 comp21025_c0_seq1/m.28235 type:complete len:207 (-) comp21025_c0_seq1:592-1212(-)
MASKYGGGNSKCQRCAKTVYMAEEVSAVGQKWHKLCFKCASCNKTLDSTTLADKDGEIYCKSCYGRNFGPKGYGFGGGAGVLNMEGPADTNVTFSAPAGPTPATPPVSSPLPVEKPESPAATPRRNLPADICPRCEKKVYMAEKIVGAGSSWHKMCFKCKLCNKTLDSTTCVDKNNELYCKGCYAKNFGPKGYGFGQGAGTLAHTQ